jgi:hypothetical protein
MVLEKRGSAKGAKSVAHSHDMAAMARRDEEKGKYHGIGSVFTVADRPGCRLAMCC